MHFDGRTIALFSCSEPSRIFFLWFLSSLSVCGAFLPKQSYFWIWIFVSFRKGCLSYLPSLLLSLCSRNNRSRNYCLVITEAIGLFWCNNVGGMVSFKKSWIRLLVCEGMQENNYSLDVSDNFHIWHTVPFYW